LLDERAFFSCLAEQVLQRGPQSSSTTTRRKPRPPDRRTPRPGHRANRGLVRCRRGRADRLTPGCHPIPLPVPGPDRERERAESRAGRTQS
jgi:hypothetical protein